jgi:hypothetical protein
MKKITFLLASALFVSNVSTTFATNESRLIGVNYNEPFSFIEKDIEFFVYPNGEFDFNTYLNNYTETSYLYRSAGSRSSQTSVRKPQNYGVLIEHDVYGRVRRVGNTFINYDNSNRVTRIGSIYMKYNKNGLTQIGGLKINYNSRGQVVSIIGTIKGYSNQAYANTYYGSSYNNNSYSYGVSYYGNSNNNSYYYYRQDGTKAVLTD